MLVRLRKNKKGFTLVELIVVIAILGVLAMLIVPRIVGNVGEATKEREISNARTLASEVTIYNASQKDKTTWITAANNTIGLTKKEYRGGAADGDPTKALELPNGIGWPSDTYVLIQVDTNGNASILEK